MKSKIGFGQYHNLTVAEMFIAQKEFKLINIYYCLAKIDFTDDILEKLHISEKIPKPGKDPGKRSAACQLFFLKLKEGRTDIENLKSALEYKKTFKIKANLRNRTNERGSQFSKLSLQFKNQNYKARHS